MTETVSVSPQFGVNYRVGDIGFTFTDNSFVSMGIAWFTKWDQGTNPDVPNIPVSHVFVVSGENECIEATLPKVKRTPLDYYFEKNHTHVFFRRPVGLTDEIGDRIVAAAATKVGLRYGTVQLVGHAIAGSIPGKVLGFLSFGLFTKIAKSAFEKKSQFICSELGAYALDEQPEYHDKGVLSEPTHSINPVRLFNTTEVFKPWTTRVDGHVLKI